MENLCFMSFNTAEVWGSIMGLIVAIILILLIEFYLFWSNPERPGGPILFVKAPENKAMYVLEGNSFSGKIILASKRFCILKKDDNYLIKEKTKITEDEKKMVLSQNNFFGMYWIGIPPVYSIYYRNQQWQEWELNKEENKNIIIARDEQTPYLIIVPFEYAMSLLEAESRNEVPLDVEFTVIVKPTDAILPIFDNDNAYGQLQRFVIATAILFIKSETFETLGGNVGEDGKIRELSDKIKVRTQVNDYFSTTIASLNKSIPGRDDKLGIKDVLGYEIIGAEINTIAISGDHKKELLKASTAKDVAEENAKATRATADGERDAEISRSKGKEATLNVEADFLKKASSIPGAMKVVERRATPGLTTLVEADSKNKPLISIK